MKISRRYAVRPSLMPLVMMSMLIVAFGFASGWGGGRAYAQSSLPGDTPPTSPVPPGAPPLPPTPTVVTETAPLNVPVDLNNGTTVLATLPPAAPGATPPELSFSMPAAALQNVTDRNGNPVLANRLVIEPVDASIAPTLPVNEININDIIRIQLLDPNGNPIERPNFNPPVVLCITPPPEQVTAAGGIENITMRQFDSLTSVWEVLTSAVIGNQICANVTHLSFFALTMVPAVVPLPAALPSTGAVDMFRLEVLLAVIAVLWLGGTLVRKRGRA
ncbi:hypothetical protein [Candidatus Chloroploca sp. Khr17]|uniref:hypothetical protein n=1 Tax=Candidatus Chloroploca sp. Khr17 TaxID=2496869 RepID=UPI00101DDC89|nr:hypothetical protein [Candidatus Chloroploca sp. Khr17]